MSTARNAPAEKPIMPDGVGHDAEALRVLTHELDRASAVVGTRLTRREVLGSRDDVADRSGLLGLWPWHRETGVDRRHRRLERRLVRRRGLHPVLEQERRVAEPGEPARNVEALVRPGIDRPPAAGDDDDADAVARLRRREHRERRVGDVAQERRADCDARAHGVLHLVRDSVDARRWAVRPKSDGLGGAVDDCGHPDRMPQRRAAFRRRPSGLLRPRRRRRAARSPCPSRRRIRALRGAPASLRRGA